MIKSTKTSIKFTNKQKRAQIKEIISEYKSVMSKFIDVVWDMDDVPRLVGKELYSKIDTWFTAALLQCACKQASGVVRGVKKKQNKRKWQINKFHSEGKYKKARKLRKIYDEISVSKPNINNIEMELGSRFTLLDLNNTTNFDGWVTLKCVSGKLKIPIPFKKSKHFNKMLENGSIKTGIRLSNKNITFMFDLLDTEKKDKGSVLGIDIGMLNVLSCSDNYSTKKNTHTHDLDSILTIMGRKMGGSEAFRKCEQHRKNYINWSINQLDLSGVKQVNLENIKYLRSKRKCSRKLSHWTYTDIFGKLESYCNEQGVLVCKVNPTYTSQRCSECGWTRKSNRKSKLFKCGQCDFTCDADLNAAKNIALPLKPIWTKQRQKQLNRKGFYWNV